MSNTTSPYKPDGTPFFGHALEYARDPIGAIEKFGRSGDIVEVDTPIQSFFLVTGPDMIQEILVRKHEKFTIGPAQQESFAGITDNAVNMSTGADWQRRRKAIRPPFTGDTVEKYRDRMIEEAVHSVGEWNDGQQFDLHKEMRLFTMRMLADTLLGINLRGNEDVIISASDALIDRANLRRVGRYLPDWIPTPTDRRFEKRVTRLDEFVDECMTKSKRTENESDVVSVLLSAAEAGVISEVEVRHNLVGLLLAGTSSPGGTLMHAWRLLNEHPTVYDDAREEYDTTTDGEGLQPADVDDLSLVHDILSETLRLYPPTVGVNRMATESVTVGGYEFSEGTQFILPQWIPHRDERFWEDPETFDPSRWQRNVDHPQFAYFPFSGGPRFCPGKKVARQEMVIALAEMIGRVYLDVETEGPLEFTPSMTLRPATKHHATVEFRRSPT